MNLTEIPHNTFMLRYIKELNISYNWLPYITALILNLKSLVHIPNIDMWTNELLNIPKIL